MESPKGVKIPDNWLIDTGVTTYWPHKEGIFVNDEIKWALLFAAVYMNLIDLPEAMNQLTLCNDQFLNDFASELLNFFKPVMRDATDGKKRTAEGAPLTSAAEIEKMTAIYLPWVKDWALGNSKMLDWVISNNVPFIVMDMLKKDFNRADLRRLDARLNELGGLISIPWVWKTLLSSDYHRMDQKKRELARRSVQDKGFSHISERGVLTRARYWIMIRILAIKPNQLLAELAGNKRDFSLTTADLSDKILRPFDDIFDYERAPGRPVSIINSSLVDSKMRFKF